MKRPKIRQNSKSMVRIFTAINLWLSIDSNSIRLGGLVHGIVSKIAHKTLSKIWTWCNYYRPQRSCGQGNIFTPVCHSFCSQSGVCLSACWDTTPHPPEQTPPEQTPPRSRHPPGADIPPGADPPEQTLPGAETPPEQTPPEQTPPPRKQNPAYGLRAVSYWNAFLFLVRSLSDLE